MKKEKVKEMDELDEEVDQKEDKARMQAYEVEKGKTSRKWKRQENNFLS